jgi:hypothetical protein
MMKMMPLREKNKIQIKRQSNPLPIVKIHSIIPKVLDQQSKIRTLIQNKNRKKKRLRDNLRKLRNHQILALHRRVKSNQTALNHSLVIQMGKKIGETKIRKRETSREIRSLMNLSAFSKNVIGKSKNILSK